MAGYLAQRVIQSAFILLGIAAFTFLLLYLVPADPAVQLAGRSATAQTVATSAASSASTSRWRRSSCAISATSCTATSGAPTRRRPTSRP
jgi:ABC-type dipeptide/oligopeptide/nickel transport system permease component